MSLVLGLLVSCERSTPSFQAPPPVVEPEPEPPAVGHALGDAPLADTGGIDPSAPVPLILITTDGTPMGPDVRMAGTIEVISEHDGTLGGLLSAPRDHAGPVALEQRGASSVTFPKRSFNLELHDAVGEDLGVALLGMPPEADWVLYGPYTDKTYVRDAYAYALARRMGGYAPRVRHVELSIDGVWQGLYQLTEKLELDEDRVDLREPATDVFGDVTGGYLFKYEGGVYDPDGWTSDAGVRYEYQDPNRHEITGRQATYLENWVDDFEAGITNGDAPADWIDVPSFVDYVLVTELSRNVDGYRRSTYLQKAPDRRGGKLHAGPVWDFNIAFGNADFCGGWDATGLVFESETVCDDWDQIPKWWITLLHDRRFTTPLRCRWEALRQDVLSDASLEALVEELAGPLRAAGERDQAIWATLGRRVWPNYYIGETWEDELSYLRSFTVTRARWMDEGLPDRCPSGRPTL